MDRPRSRCMRRLISSLLGLTFLLGLWYVAFEQATVARAQTPSPSIPTFQGGPSWLKPLPNNWVLGAPAGVTVDARDHVWVLHRPALAPAAEIAAGKKAAPPVVEFDPQGNLVQAWGGPGAGYDWLKGDTISDYPRGTAAEHGIYVDHKDNVWVTGNGDMVLKFTRTGKFLLQIGEFLKSGGSNDTRLLGNPTDILVDPSTNELFVSDGYVNRRVIVFDADTGKYKRHWGAYGKKPDDGPPVLYEAGKPLPQQFFIVHCIRQAKDGLLYVCDRQRNRIQVFRRDGTFVSERVIEKNTPAGGGITMKGPTSKASPAGFGSGGRAAFSADAKQEYLYVAGRNDKLWILRRSDLQILGSFEARGTHDLTVDSKGNLYTSGTRFPEKFVFKGVVRSPSVQ